MVEQGSGGVEGEATVAPGKELVGQLGLDGLAVEQGARDGVVRKFGERVPASRGGRGHGTYAAAERSGQAGGEALLIGTGRLVGNSFWQAVRKGRGLPD